MAILKAVVAALFFVGANASYGIGGFPGYFKAVGDNFDGPTFDYWTKQPDDHNWVGLYPAGDEGPSHSDAKLGARQAPAPDALIWAYAPGQNNKFKIPGAESLPQGGYEAYFLSENYTWLAPPVQVTIGLTHPGKIVDVDPNNGLRIKYKYPVAGTKNWIGVWFYSGGGPLNGQKDESSIIWKYAPETEGTLEFDNSGLGAGVYKAFFLSDDGYTSTATPVVFTIANAAEYPGSVAINLNAEPWYLRWATTKRVNGTYALQTYHHGDQPLQGKALHRLTAVGYYGVGKADPAEFNLPPGKYDVQLVTPRDAQDRKVLAKPITISL
ncbi:hypothetical protein NLG97_g2125 [Lecanicillium saksenae]|uniref:Uncharacterized protein n=1 Tax=Lecanicillium saksenae TaxID=468837 RepID=A0ACC1R3K0_9HYPO|nr:hypothetical protein NLG97_g2125 [Lecanicillium saksenae]